MFLFFSFGGRAYLCPSYLSKTCSDFEKVKLSHVSNLWVGLISLVSIIAVQVPTLTLKCTNLVIHRRTRLFECFIVENPISATVNFDFKLHKCNIPPQNTSYQVFCGKKNPIYASVNPDLKLQKCSISPQNTSFCAFYSEKLALCKCQL